MILPSTTTTMWLMGFLAADDNSRGEPSTNWANIALIGGMVVAMLTAGVALYRASAQRGLDSTTTKKIDEEVKRLQTEHDQRRTKRVLRLEKYVDDNVDYQRRQGAYVNAIRTRVDELMVLVEEAISAGFLPEHKLPGPLPKSPDLPPLPPMPDPENGD